MKPGERVVRGPDWDFEGNEIDGGDGFVGTVVAVGGNPPTLPKKLVWVQWDSGIRHDHRAGYHGAYDLYVLDSSSAGIRHPGTKCQFCEQVPIFGARWDCADCTQLCSLCTTCYMQDEHEKSHNFKRIDAPGHEAILVGKRIETQKIQARGVFPGARVTRGPDWNVGTGVGGNGQQGVLVKLTSWEDIPKAGAVVSWDRGDKSTCRLGADGKVDLQFVEPGSGGFYYKTHLRKLGENNALRETSQSNGGEKEQVKSKRNDKTPRQMKKLTNPDKKDLIRGIQTMNPVTQEHTNKALQIPQRQLAESTANDGAKVKPREQAAPISDRDKREMFHSREKRQMVTAKKVPGETAKNPTSTCGIRCGESVSVYLDEEVVKAMNIDYEPWKEDMRKYLGKSGTFHSLSAKGGVNIVYPDKTLWTFHPDLVTKAGQNFPKTIVGPKWKHDVQTSLKEGDLVKILQDEEVVKQLQQSHGPWDDTVRKVLGGTGKVLGIDLKGDVEVIVGTTGNENVIIFNPAVLCLTKQDGNGDINSSTLDSPTYADPQEIENLRKATALLGGASSAGDLPVVKAVVEKYPSVINNLDHGGHTALHSACHQGHFEVVEFLLSSGADMKIKDLQGYTTLHHAAYGDRTGRTATLLISKGVSKDDNSNDCGSTPLHLAIKEYNSKTAEVLIENGCDINLAEIDGSTALALTFRFGNVDVLRSLLKRGDLVHDLATCRPFYSAITQKDCPATVKEIIGRYPEIASEKLEEDMTPLHFAALYNNAELAKFLLEKGKCDFDLKNSDGMKPIMLAQDAGSTEVLKLFTTKVNLDASSETRSDAYHVIAAKCSEFAYQNKPKRLNIDHDFKVGDRVQICGNKALVKAFQVGHAGWVSDMELVLNKYGYIGEVLENGDVRVVVQDPIVAAPLVLNPRCLDPAVEINQESGSSLLSYYTTDSASSWRGSETVGGPLMRDFFLNKELEDLLVSFDGSTPENWRRDLRMKHAYMYVAVAMGCSTKIERIATHCREALVPIENVPPPLHMACINGDLEVVDVLLKNGANISEKEPSGHYTPLHCAAVGDNTGEVAGLLIKHGANVNENLNFFLATPMHLAAAYGNDAVASKIIELCGPRCDLTLKDNQGGTALSRAVHCGREKMVKRMLTAGNCDLKIPNDQGFNVLHMAALQENEKVVEMIVGRGSGALINSKTHDSNGMTPLHLACHEGHAGVVRVLLQKGCDFRIRNNLGRTPLGVAVSAKAKNDAVIALFMKMYEPRRKQGAAPLEAESGHAVIGPPAFCVDDVVKVHSNSEVLSSLHPGMNVQQLAGKCGFVQTIGDDGDVELMIEGLELTLNLSPWAVIPVDPPRSFAVSPRMTDQRPKPDLMGQLERKIKGDYQWHSELIQAVCTSHLSKLKREIKMHKDVGKIKLRGTTLLHIAARNGAIPIMEELLDNEADANAQDNRHCTPLHVAAAKERTGLGTKLLLKRGAKPNEQGFDDLQRTPLHLAVCRNNFAAAKVLTENQSCDVNLEDIHGDSPLHCAIDQEKQKLVELIAKLPGCKPLLTNRDGHNALHLSASRGNESALLTIVEVFPDIDTPDNDGNTALHLAALKGFKEIVKILLQRECNVDLENHCGFTAYYLASINGHSEVKQLFPERKNEFSHPGGRIDPGVRGKTDSEDSEDEDLQSKPAPLEYWDLDEDDRSPSRQIFYKKKETKHKRRADPDPERFYEEIPVVERLNESRHKSILENRLQPELQAATFGAAYAESTTEDKANKDETKENEMCCMCKNSKAEVRFLPCKDKVTCEKCSFYVKKCPTCSYAVAEKVSECVTEEELAEKATKRESAHVTSQSSNSGAQTSIITTEVVQNSEVSATNLCTKCQKLRASVTFKPCGHKVNCEECSFYVKKCPTCSCAVAEKISE